VECSSSWTQTPPCLFRPSFRIPNSLHYDPHVRDPYLPFERTTNNQAPDISIYQYPYLHPAVSSFRSESVGTDLVVGLHWLLVIVNEYLATISLSMSPFLLSPGTLFTTTMRSGASRQRRQLPSSVMMTIVNIYDKEDE
jgi:hypothetical protein